MRAKPALPDGFGRRRAAPYTPATPFSSVSPDAFPGLTLLEVLQAGGGGLQALGRHSVAALLNAASSSVDYPLTATEVIDLFGAAIQGSLPAIEGLKDTLEFLNESGCGL